MAIDYFVLFKHRQPIKSDLKMLLEDYLNGAGSIDYSKEEEQGRWYVTLPGLPSFPFKRLEPDLGARQEMLPDERWFEVYVGHIHQSPEDGMGPNIDVITRMADEYTNVVALGFAELVVRYYQAELSA